MPYMYFYIDTNTHTQTHTHSQDNIYVSRGALFMGVLKLKF